MITGPQIMGLFLGDSWETAGLYLQWLAPWFFLASIASPLTRVFDILERQRIDFITSTVIFVVQMGLFIAGCLTGDLTTTLLLLSTGGLLARIIHIAVMLRLAAVDFKTALRPYGVQCLLAAPFCLVLLIVTSFQRPWLTTLALVLSGIVFLSLVYRRLTPYGKE